MGKSQFFMGQITIVQQALEEGKVCSLNEDDLREANDVLMEELRKAETSWPFLEGTSTFFPDFWMIFDVFP